jgi:hypothetical protein
MNIPDNINDSLHKTLGMALTCARKLKGEARDDFDPQAIITSIMWEMERIVDDLPDDCSAPEAKLYLVMAVLKRSAQIVEDAAAERNRECQNPN